MAGRGDPPEGTPEGLPGGGEDEYRSVVFDESFVRAARLQEFSAQERMGDHARAVRSLPALSLRTGSKSVLVLVLLVAIAFGTAIYLGVRHPYQAPPAKQAEPLRITLIPLAPQGPVPGGAPGDL
ncbi:SCO2583 family membrane protein, partial [Streptomyces sp. NPDC055078]